MDFESENAKEWRGAWNISPDEDENRPPSARLPDVAEANRLHGTSPKGPSLAPAQQGFKRTGTGRNSRATPARGKPFSLRHSDRFALNRDNAAKDAWRRRQEGNGVTIVAFRLPSYCKDLYHSLYQTVQRSRDPSKTTSLQVVLEQIGQQTETFIPPPSRSNQLDLRIWGRPAQVRAAQEELMAWLRRTQAAELNNKHWSKIYCQSEKFTESLDKIMEDEAHKQSFRRHPPKGVRFEHMGAFLWPDYGFKPIALLGNNLEALDSVRTEHRCYITWESQRSFFLVLGSAQRAIDNAIARVKTTLCEIATRSRATKIYMIEPLKPHAIRREVALVPYKQEVGIARLQAEKALASVVPVMTGMPPSSEERGNWSILQSNVGYSNEVCFKRVVGARLASARYYRGHVRMRVHLGIMRLSTYKRPGAWNHSLEDFFAMLRNPQAEAEVVCEVKQDAIGVALLSYCREASGFLTPADALTQSLEMVPPDFSASFELDAVNKLGSMRLDIGFVKSVGGSYEPLTSRWLKMDTTTGFDDVNAELARAKLPLSVILVDLQSRAWELVIACRNLLDKSRTTQAMQYFLDGVRLKLSPQTKQESHSIPAPFVTFRQTELRVESYVLNTHFRYMLKDSPYLLEITRSQKKTKLEKGIAQQTETSWSLSIYSREWDAILEQQSNLHIGEAGPWKMDLNRFFPIHGPSGGLRTNEGIKQFWEKVWMASQFIEKGLSLAKTSEPPANGNEESRLSKKDGQSTDSKLNKAIPTNDGDMLGEYRPNKVPKEPIVGPAASFKPKKIKQQTTELSSTTQKPTTEETSKITAAEIDMFEASFTQGKSSTELSKEAAEEIFVKDASGMLIEGITTEENLNHHATSEMKRHPSNTCNICALDTKTSGHSVSDALETRTIESELGDENLIDMFDVEVTTLEQLIVEGKDKIAGLGASNTEKAGTAVGSEGPPGMLIDFS